MQLFVFFYLFQSLKHSLDIVTLVYARTHTTLTGEVFSLEKSKMTILGHEFARFSRGLILNRYV